METIAEWLTYGVPTIWALVLSATASVERALLRAGRGGLQHFVAQDEGLVDRGFLARRRAGSLARLVLLQLGTDLTSPGPLLLMLGPAASCLVVGFLAADAATVTIGLVVLLIYVWMFVTTVTSCRAVVDQPIWRARLLEIDGPSFLGLGTATLESDDGGTFESAVPWRPAAHAHGSGEVDLLFVGARDDAHFVGLRPLRTQSTVNADAE